MQPSYISLFVDESSYLSQKRKNQTCIRSCCLVFSVNLTGNWPGVEGIFLYSFFYLVIDWTPFFQFPFNAFNL